MENQRTKPTCILLHGALGSAEQVGELASRLEAQFDVATFGFPGHGGDPIPEHGMDMAHFSSALTTYLQQNFKEPVLVFGYSMGGYIAMSVAVSHPQLIRGLITLGTKWDWSPEIAAAEVRMLNPEMMAEKVPALVELLIGRHAPIHWQDLVKATANMLIKLGDHPLFNGADLVGINFPTIILRGSADRMISADESMRVAHLVRNGQYAELPEQKHPFEQVDLALLMPYFHEMLAN